jgi:hypothetical protein
MINHSNTIEEELYLANKNYPESPIERINIIEINIIFIIFNIYCNIDGDMYSSCSLPIKQK